MMGWRLCAWQYCEEVALVFDSHAALLLCTNKTSETELLNSPNIGAEQTKQARAEKV